jgi:hypothetical protein
MEDFDFSKAWSEALEKKAANSLEPVLARLPPQGRAWLNSLNPFCLWAVEHDLRQMPDAFVKHWEYVRDTLQRLELELGPSENWK